MSLPYRWHPLGADGKYKLEPGDILAWEHAVYRVQLVESRPTDHDENCPVRVIMRPIEITGDDVRDRDHDRALKAPEHYYWQVYPTEHYPICVKCQEPLPCREQMIEQVAAASAEDFERYSTPGVCPACDKPVSSRQKSISWPDNVVVPFGPPVTFHLRNECRWDAIRYEKRWHAGDPEHRPVTLSCTGHATYHYDGTRECDTETCPGKEAQHQSSSRHYPGHTDCHCVAGIPVRTEERAGQDTERDLLRLFEGES
jgi:hypothetical protein